MPFASGATGLRIPSVEDIDPSFIFISPAVTKGSEFQAGEEYLEPVPPRVIDGVDYQAQRDSAVRDAERFVRAKSDLLGSAGSTVYDRVFAIMKHRRYRAGTLAQTRFEENKDIFRPTITARIDAGEPIVCVLPSFPFKLPNPAKTSRRSPDMAELLCLRRLYELCHAVSLVYPPGMQFVIASDGEIYRRLCGVSAHEAAVYSQITREMIKVMGASDRISYTDMPDLIATRRDEFDHLSAALRPTLEQWWRRNPDDLRRLSLIRNSMSNLNTSTHITQDLVQIATKNLIGVAGDDADLLEDLRRIRSQLAKRADESAFEFALLLYTLKELDIFRSCYPEALRATVHPKPGQWGINLVDEHCRVLPWAGAAFHKGRDTWRVRYEWDLHRSGARPVHLAGDAFPFFYENPRLED